jgi:hypothetical protein
MAVTYSYDNAAIKEDLLGVITNLDFKEYQLGSGLSQSKAEAVIHQWLKDTLKTPAANAGVEGADAAFAARTSPTRLTNHTQIITIDYAVSGTDKASNAAGFGDRFAYEMEKAMKEFKQDQEFALMRSTLACGTGSAARSMKGLKAWLANTTNNSGVSYTEATLNDDLQAVWDDGTEVNAIYAPMYLKRKISGFTSGSTKNIQSADRRLVNSVDVYQADAASNVKLFAHRFVTVSGDTNYDIVGINEDMFKIAYLRAPKNVPLAKTGDADKAQIIGEMTLECLHDNAGFKRTAIL